MNPLLDVCYSLAIAAGSPWIVYRMLSRRKYCRGLTQKVLGEVPVGHKRAARLWFHAVSVGEVKLLEPVLKELRDGHPACEILISTTTETGMDLARQKYADLTTFFCPLDFSWAVHRAVTRVKPDVLVLAELEIWPNLILAAKQARAKVAVINARLGEKSFRGYHRFRGVFHRVFQKLDLVAAQSRTYAARFRRLGVPCERVLVTGSVKFDGVETNRLNPTTQKLRELAGITPQDIVWIAGSTQEPEERMVLEVFEKLQSHWPQLKLIIVPRHPHRFDSVAQLLDNFRVRWCRRSRLNGRLSDPTTRVVLVDTVGELWAWWGIADIAFVGGSFGKRGGQNMLEPAAYGAAVCFGPNTWNFRDIVELLLADAAVQVVHSQQELSGFVGRCLADPEFRNSLGKRARRVVLQHRGAARRTGAALADLLKT